MGTSALRVVQFGRESTYGTGVAAAAIMSGVTEASFTPNAVNTMTRTLQGSFAPATSVTQTYRSASASIAGYLTPEDFIYILDSGVRGSISPSGAGPYLYTYNFPTTASPATRSRTLEFYDGQQAWEMPGGIVESFTITAESNEDSFVMFESEWLGTDATSTTLTGSLTGRAFTLLPANNSTLYSDAIGGTVGSTAISSTLIGWSFECNTGQHTKKFMTGALTPDSRGYNVMDITLTLTLEYNASGDAFLDDFVAGTSRLLRLRTTGASSTQLTIDGAYSFQSVSEVWGDRDGNTTIEITAKPFYDSTFANYVQMVVQNNVSAFVTNA